MYINNCDGLNFYTPIYMYVVNFFHAHQNRSKVMLNDPMVNNLFRVLRLIVQDHLNSLHAWVNRLKLR